MECWHWEKLFDENFTIPDYFEDFQYVMDEKEILKEFDKCFGKGKGIVSSFSFLLCWGTAHFGERGLTMNQ